MIHYFVVKVDGEASARDVASSLREALDSDNMYRHVDRALVADVHNVDVQAAIDGHDLRSTESESIDNTQNC